MYGWLVVWQFVINIVCAMLDVRLLNTRYAGSQFECFDYPSAMPLRSFDTGWRLPMKIDMLDMTTPKHWFARKHGFDEISRRIDLVWNRDDIIKEHAKLVQDINGLRQIVHVAPLAEERDYEDSIFPEIIETLSTTTRRPSTTKKVKATKGGFPVLLVGGGSRKHGSKSQPPKVPKKTVSLVGTASPIVRHPYPFVMAASSHQPVTICMSSPITYSTTTRRPSLWERIVKAVIPR